MQFFLRKSTPCLLPFVLARIFDCCIGCAHFTNVLDVSFPDTAHLVALQLICSFFARLARVLVILYPIAFYLRTFLFLFVKRRAHHTFTFFLDTADRSTIIL